MLQFWKKSGHNEKRCYAPDNKSPGPGASPKTKTATSPRKTPLSPGDDEGLFDIGEFETVKERSRLSKTLVEVLSDKGALTYFGQYMESRGASSYLNCWLEIDGFKTDLGLYRDNCRKLTSPGPHSRNDHDSLSVSTDCDSFTAESASLNDYSMDAGGRITSISQESSTTSSSSTSSNGFCDKDTTSDTSPKLIVDGGATSINNNNNNNNTKLIVEGASCNDKTNFILEPSLNNNNNNNKILMIEGACGDDTKLRQHFIDGALAIFKKFIAQEAPSTIKCPELLRNEIIENVCDNEKIVSGECFDHIQNFIFDIMDREYFEAFFGSDYYCKHQIDVLTSGNVALDDILYNETALFYFMEYLEQEQCRSLLEFWIAATNLHQQLQNQKQFFDPIEAQNDAIVLYDKYFSLQAHCPLGFSDRVRFAVEQSICGENGLVIDCFHLPLKIVEQILERNYLKSFLASQLFYKYLSELINTVQSNGYAMNIENNKQSPSDCSSERSFSTNSTFLALEINGTRRHCKDNKCAVMSIDTRELCDPDALWRRKRSHVLSCGRITALGKFETDLEPEPDRREFKLKDVVKKFVNLEEDKKREEMAWQVAEMIVKDITSVTLSQEGARKS